MDKKTHIFVLIISLPFLISSFVFCQEAESWEKWLEDVEPIITKAEMEVFRS
jgi:hypothetical protein